MQKIIFHLRKKRPGILSEHCFEPKGNHYATLPWFGIQIAQRYARKDQKEEIKYSGLRRLNA